MNGDDMDADQEPLFFAYLLELGHRVNARPLAVRQRGYVYGRIERDGHPPFFEPVHL